MLSGFFQYFQRARLIKANKMQVKKISQPILRFEKKIGVFLLAFCSSLYANEPMDSLDYENDISLKFLLYTLGPLVPTSGGIVPADTVLSYLISHFLPLITIIALSIGSIMIYFTTISSANQGKSLSSSWSNPLLPFRVGAGLSLLIPDKYGFALIQKIFLWFILNGISLANSLWNQVIDNHQLGYILNNQVVQN